MRGVVDPRGCARSQHRLDLLHFLLLQALGEDGALARSHRVVFVLLGDGVEEAAVLRIVLLLRARLVLFNAVPAVQVVAQRLRGETERRRQQEEKSAHEERHVVRLRRVVNCARKRRTCVKIKQDSVLKCHLNKKQHTVKDFKIIEN